MRFDNKFMVLLYSFLCTLPHERCVSARSMASICDKESSDKVIPNANLCMANKYWIITENIANLFPVWDLELEA